MVMRLIAFLTPNAVQEVRMLTTMSIIPDQVQLLPFQAPGEAALAEDVHGLTHQNITTADGEGVKILVPPEDIGALTAVAATIAAPQLISTGVDLISEAVKIQVSRPHHAAPLIVVA